MTVVEGIVEHGDARGRTIGFPTANLAICDPGVEDGVWAAQIRVDSDQWAVAAVSVGRRRTFYTGQGPRLLEAHLLDFNGDLYGRTMRVELTVRSKSLKNEDTGVVRWAVEIFNQKDEMIATYDLLTENTP